MNSICRYIPAKSGTGNLKTVHFVYETEFKKMKQPFMQPLYYMYLVTRGSGVYRLGSSCFDISEGTLFFSFPGISYTIEAGDDFTYMYISFMGSRSAELYGEFGITPTSCVFHGFDEEAVFWKRSIQRMNDRNSNILAECVLLHTLSFLGIESDGVSAQKNSKVIDNIIDYIDSNYRDPDISLRRIADIFSYTDKYLSHLFKSSMNINWSTYLNRLRIQNAVQLINNGADDITEVALSSGYRDPVYFSKVFKKLTGRTPREYIGQRSEMNK